MPLEASRSRQEKARRFLDTAHYALQAGDYESCVSRAYYACYHSIVNVVEVRSRVRRQRWSHDGLHQTFLERFCKQGLLFTRGHGETFGKLMFERRVADYEVEAFDRGRAQRLLAGAEGLVEKVEEVLG